MADSKLISLDGLANAQLATMQSSLLKAQQLAGSTATSTTDTDKSAAAHEQKIQKAGTQFEALLVQEMLKEMWKTVPQGGLLSGSKDEQTYQDMYQQALATNIAEHRSLGIKDVIIKDIRASEARHSGAANKTPSGGTEGSS